MEQFNSKIYDKYKNLKKRRLSEDEDWNHKREADIKDYQTANNELIEELKSENEQLRVLIASLQVRYSESQKLLLEESRKTKELSNEVDRLQNMLLEKNDNQNTTSPRSPYTSPRVRTSRDTFKASPKKNTPSACATESDDQHNEATIIPYQDNQEDQILPDCCRCNTTSGNASGRKQQICAFQTLMEFLVKMKLSLQHKPDGYCVSAIHQRSDLLYVELSYQKRCAGGE